MDNGGKRAYWYENMMKNSTDGPPTLVRAFTLVHHDAPDFGDDSYKATFQWHEVDPIDNLIKVYTTSKEAAHHGGNLQSG
jgi:hypothetical protein